MGAFSMQTVLFIIYTGTLARAERFNRMEGSMGAFSMQTVLFIIYTMLGFVAALAAIMVVTGIIIMVVTGIIRFLVRKALGRIEPDPNATTYPTEVPRVA